MNNKQRAEKKRTRDRIIRLGEFWSMLELVSWSALDLNIEEPGC
jgi:hypothetical protein